MKRVSLSLKSVGSLAGERFFIPSYQRGYRWEEDQVEALLDDLAEFEAANDATKFYCLQPLVVVKRKDENEWEVIDGQQRLTTIFLILKQRSLDGAPPFHIRYERHPQSKNGLFDLLQPGSAEKSTSGFPSPDLHFIHEADRVIEEWFQTHKDRSLSILRNHKREEACAQFIWHEIDDRCEAIPTFTRLNAGKIRLKDSELIRALFLKTGELEQDDRYKIALCWDQMERRLQEPEFWSFLSQKGDDSDNRIELLFRVLAEQKKWSKTKDRAIFGRICELLTSEEERKKLWQEMEDLFGTLEEWFEDNELFHLIGFLVVEQGASISELLEEASKLEKRAFTLHLKKKIREGLLPKDASPDELKAYLESVEYGTEGIKALKKLLLCLNLATLCADKTNTVRFSFYAYRKEGWDIEHIRATASRSPESKDEVKVALKMIGDYWRTPGLASDEGQKKGLNESQRKDLENIEQALAKGGLTPEQLGELYNSVRDWMEDNKELGESNGLGNLTLLDAGTNRGYGNSPFAVKRKWILDLDQQAKYLLPCTRNVFTKSYSKAPANLLHWTAEDAEDYRSSAINRLEMFFVGTWEEIE